MLEKYIQEHHHQHKHVREFHPEDSNSLRRNIYKNTIINTSMVENCTQKPILGIKCIKIVDMQFAKENETFIVLFYYIKIWKATRGMNFNQLCLIKNFDRGHEMTN